MSMGFDYPTESDDSFLGLWYPPLSFRRPFDPYRAEFVQRSGMLPPPFLRIIDCQRSVKRQRRSAKGRAVVLIDWDFNAPGDGGYTAISHTSYMMDVYAVFNCDCATKCLGICKPRADPAKMPCKKHVYDEDPHAQQRAIKDILKMCRILLKAGVRYAWHDGVCIAQHDEEEVRLFIRHMGWIYANAKETMIFLHYIGMPMAPIATGSDERGLTSRWQTRVWTYQEAVLSKRRRYCVCVGDVVGYCRNPEEIDREHHYSGNLLEFEQMLSSWYDGGDSNIIIIEECEFSNLIVNLSDRLAAVFRIPRDRDRSEKWELESHESERVHEWRGCLRSWRDFIDDCLLSFPNIAHALCNCSRRDSKHEGDRINSILGLAGVQGFDAHKDDNVEESTRELFERMGTNAFALALFTTNEFSPPSKANTSIHQHTWLPSLSGPLLLNPSHLREKEPNFHTDDIQFEVLENGNIELKGLLAFVDVQFNKLKKKERKRERRAGFSTHSDTLKEQATLPSAEDGRLNVSMINVRDHITCLIGPCEGYEGHHEIYGVDEMLGDPIIYKVFKRNIPDKLDLQYKVGEMYIPKLDVGSIYHIFQQGHHVTMRQFFEKRHMFYLTDAQKVHAFSKGTQNAAWEAEIQTVFNKRAIPLGGERMESFCASLIFPAKVLELDFEWNFSAIVVHGDINSQVAKIGCFSGTKALHDILKHQHVPISRINNLVIR